MENLFGNTSVRKGFLQKIHAYWGSIPLVIIALLILSFFLSTITCLIKPGTTYERFDTLQKTQDTQKDLAKEARKLLVQLQQDDALLDKVSDVTCSVYKQISQSQIQSDSAPTLDTPRPVDNAALNRSAVQKFQQAQKNYMATHLNQPLLECFAAEEDADANSDLLSAYTALNAQLNDTNMKLKARKVNATLGFTKPYVVNLMNGFTPTTEAFNLQGSELVVKTQALIQEAKKTHDLIQALPNVALHQKQVLDLVNAQKAKVSSPAGATAKKDDYAEQAKDPKYSE